MKFQKLKQCVGGVHLQTATTFTDTPLKRRQSVYIISLQNVYTFTDTLCLEAHLVVCLWTRRECVGEQVDVVGSDR